MSSCFVISIMRTQLATSCSLTFLHAINELYLSFKTKETKHQKFHRTKLQISVQLFKTVITTTCIAENFLYKEILIFKNSIFINDRRQVKISLSKSSVQKNHFLILNLLLPSNFSSSNISNNIKAGLLKPTGFTFTFR